jgi:hypothetical protein
LRRTRVEDRKWIRGAPLIDQELQLALNAQREGRWNEAWAQRYVTQRECSSLTYTDVVAFVEESKRLAESKSPDYLTAVISRIISDAEQKHLFNLALGDEATKEYQGRGSLQSELRHLLTLGLLIRRPGRTIGEMRGGTTFDLADYVELNPLGSFWISRVRESRVREPDVA